MSSPTSQAVGKLDADLCFQQVPGIGPPSATWASSNRELHTLVCRHRHRLKDCVAIAANIRRDLEALFPLIGTVSTATCPECQAPCCVVTKVWYDFIDLLFLHLIAVPLPPAPLADSVMAPCRYLSASGCLLVQLIRPWGCIQYTCPTQEHFLERFHPHANKHFYQDLDRIKNARYQLESAFLRAASKINRPSGDDHHGLTRCFAIQGSSATSPC